MQQRSYNNAALSIGIVCFFIGLCALVFLHSFGLSDTLNEEMDLIVELNNQATEEDKNAILQFLKTQNKVKPGTIELLTKETALTEMTKELKMLGVENDHNPFLDMVLFNVKKEFYTEDDVAQLSIKLQEISGVNSVVYNEAFGNELISNLRKIGWGIMIFCLLLVFFSLVIIYNTVKVSLMERRKEIRVMELVGAKRGFIVGVFMGKMRKVGIQAAIISAILLFAVIIVFYINNDWFKDIIRLEFVLVSILLSMVFSVVLAWFSSRWILGRFIHSKRGMLN